MRAYRYFLFSITSYFLTFFSLQLRVLSTTPDCKFLEILHKCAQAQKERLRANTFESLEGRLYSRHLPAMTRIWCQSAPAYIQRGCLSLQLRVYVHGSVWEKVTELLLIFSLFSDWLWISFLIFRAGSNLKPQPWLPCLKKEPDFSHGSPWPWSAKHVDVWVGFFEVSWPCMQRLQLAGETRLARRRSKYQVMSFSQPTT